MALDCLTAGNNIPTEINVIIEVPAHSEPIKYEMGIDATTLVVSHFLTTSMHYPCDYGYMPRALTMASKPLEVLVITPSPVNRGCVVRCRPLGVLVMNEGKRHDHKILALPCPELTNKYDHVDSIEDLPDLLVQKIAHFFTHYRDLEAVAAVSCEGWLNIDAAKKEIMASIARYEDQHIKSCA